MKITDIKQQEKNKSRYSVYADGKYSFSLSDWQLSKTSLRVGQEIAQSELDKLKHDSDLGKVYDRALKWLALRPRSEWEIDEYLKKKTSDESVISAVKSKIVDINQVNDQAFAHSWVSSRRSLKNVSKYRLTQELRQKRVPDEVIAKTLQQDEVTDVDTLVKLIEKKSRQSRYQDRDKLLAFLARQGFKYDDIQQAFTQLGM